MIVAPMHCIIVFFSLGSVRWSWREVRRKREPAGGLRGPAGGRPSGPEGGGAGTRKRTRVVSGRENGFVIARSLAPRRNYYEHVGGDGGTLRRARSPSRGVSSDAGGGDGAKGVNGLPAGPSCPELEARNGENGA